MTSRQARQWIEWAARAGFVAKGIVYLLLGYLAWKVAFGEGGRLTDPRGAIHGLVAQPHGRAIVGVVALGLVAYAAWRLIEAFADADGEGTDRRGIAKRAAYAGSGLVYAALAVDALMVAFASASGHGRGMAPASLVGTALGTWVVFLVAAGLMVYGIQQVWRAIDGKLSDRLSLGALDGDTRRVVVGISRAGIAARGVVFGLTGFVLLRARARPTAAAHVDTSDSLRLLTRLPEGHWLLALVAAGLMAFGLYVLVHARYRRITPP